MDDFGQDATYPESKESHPPEPGKLSVSTSPLPPRMRSPSSPRAESPAPFSQYPAPTPSPVTQIRVTRPSTEAQQTEREMDEDRESGCCKCVIM